MVDEVEREFLRYNTIPPRMMRIAPGTRYTRAIPELVR
jgi:hypothetical protein